jgi:hypothetical protein
MYNAVTALSREPTAELWLFSIIAVSRHKSRNYIFFIHSICNGTRVLLSNCPYIGGTTEQNASRRANGRSFAQDSPYVVWKTKFRYYVPQRPSLQLASDCIDPVQNVRLNYWQINFAIVVPATPKSCQWFLPLRFQHLWTHQISSHVKNKADDVFGSIRLI